MRVIAGKARRLPLKTLPGSDTQAHHGPYKRNFI